MIDKKVLEPARIEPRSANAGWERENWELKFDLKYPSQIVAWRQGKHGDGQVGVKNELREFIRQLVASELARQRKQIAKEVESAVAATLGYIGDDEEAQAAINRWETLRPKVLTQAAKKVRGE